MSKEIYDARVYWESFCKIFPKYQATPQANGLLRYFIGQIIVFPIYVMETETVEASEDTFHMEKPMCKIQWVDIVDPESPINYYLGFSHHLKLEDVSSAGEK